VLCARFFFSSRRRHTRSKRDWSSDVCSSDLLSTRWGRRPTACADLTAGGNPSHRNRKPTSAPYSKTKFHPFTCRKYRRVCSCFRSEERRVGKERGVGGAEYQ